MSADLLTPAILARSAVIYVRQSTMLQVTTCLESQRRQYHLAEVAQTYGFAQVDIIDEDLGRSASGQFERPGFEKLVARLCAQEVGAVLCTEASRLARNGRDWHQLLELCALVGALVIDTQGIYDPRRSNDRLLLGLKGTMSEFELHLLRERLSKAQWAKAERGELRIGVPIGFCWPPQGTVQRNPNSRVQQTIALIFEQFKVRGSARQVWLWMRQQAITFPGRPLEATTPVWKPPTYRQIISVLTNPFYAGAYVYGKSRVVIEMANGRGQKRYGRALPRDQWRVLIRDHHEGYIDWSQWELNQQVLTENSYSRSHGTRRSGRGGHSLIAGLLRCRRCGRMMSVTYPSTKYLCIRYRCRGGPVLTENGPCLTVGGRQVEETIAEALLEVVQPHAVEAAMQAHEQVQRQAQHRQELLASEVEQARYAARLAQRRYEAVDPDNRLVAAELEKSWNQALEQLHHLQRQLNQPPKPTEVPVDLAVLRGLAANLESVWSDPSVDPQLRQRIAHFLIEEVVLDATETSIGFVIHWRGGRHSTHSVRRLRSGEHRYHTPVAALPILKAMAGESADADIAAELNRRGLKTGKGHVWTAEAVGRARRKHHFVGYAPRRGDGQFLTTLGAAKKYGVNPGFFRRLILRDELPAKQLMRHAPYQIAVEDLEFPAIQEKIAQARNRRLSQTTANTPAPEDATSPTAQ